MRATPVLRRTDHGVPRWGSYRDSPPEESSGSLTWDPDRALYSAVAVSMLVHPNTISTEYAARVQTFEDGDVWVSPGPVRGYSAQTFAHLSRGSGRLLRSASKRSGRW